VPGNFRKSDWGICQPKLLNQFKAHYPSRDFVAAFPDSSPLLLPNQRIGGLISVFSDWKRKNIAIGFVEICDFVRIFPWSGMKRSRTNANGKCFVSSLSILTGTDYAFHAAD
jgi:hypothetical protein